MVLRFYLNNLPSLKKLAKVEEKKLINSDFFKLFLGREILLRNKIYNNDFVHNLYFQNSCKISGNISETEICKWENNNKFKLRKLYKKYHKYQFIQ